MNIYIYPIENKGKSTTNNPYIEDFISSLEGCNCKVVNKSHKKNIGILSIIIYFHSIDVFVFNWIENVVDRRFGLYQYLLFLFIIPAIKLFNKKIVWVMHNKVSHSKNRLFLKVIMTYIMINNADIIFTHSREGVNYAKSMQFNISKDNVYFVHHPIKLPSSKIPIKDIQQYDILIWGAISPYKGIDTFLDYLKSNNLLEKYKICIAGKIHDNVLKDRLLSYNLKTISILNEFISNDYLDKLILKSKLVLFTYSGYSTLSSGALMYTLSKSTLIIGPDIGAFRDLKDDRIIDTFKEYNDLIDKIDRALAFNNKKNLNYMNIFIKKNSWNQFAKKICNKIYKMSKK